MNILDEIKAPIIKLSAMVSNAILNREHTVLKKEEHIIYIDAVGLELQIWNANGAEYTSIHRVNGESVLRVDMPNAEECRKILREETHDERQIRIAKVKAEMKELGLCPKDNR